MRGGGAISCFAVIFSKRSFGYCLCDVVFWFRDASSDRKVLIDAHLDNARFILMCILVIGLSILLFPNSNKRSEGPV